MVLIMNNECYEINWLPEMVTNSEMSAECQEELSLRL